MRNSEHISRWLVALRHKTTQTIIRQPEETNHKMNIIKALKVIFEPKNNYLTLPKKSPFSEHVRCYVLKNILDASEDFLVSIPGVE